MLKKEIVIFNILKLKRKLKFIDGIWWNSNSFISKTIIKLKLIFSATTKLKLIYLKNKLQLIYVKGKKHKLKLNEFVNSNSIEILIFKFTLKITIKIQIYFVKGKLWWIIVNAFRNNRNRVLKNKLKLNFLKLKRKLKFIDGICWNSNSFILKTVNSNSNSFISKIRNSNSNSFIAKTKNSNSNSMSL